MLKYKINYQKGGNFIEKNNDATKFLSNNYIDKSTIENSGLGVFANKDYKKDDIVELNPYIEYVDNYTGLEDYKFISPNDSSKNVIVLGNGSMMNHNDKYNINYSKYEDKNFIQFIANKNINKGEELFINYGPYYEWKK